VSSVRAVEFLLVLIAAIRGRSKNPTTTTTNSSAIVVVVVLAPHRSSGILRRAIDSFKETHHPRGGLGEKKTNDDDQKMDV
jgi:hypothetical protein